MDKMFHLLLQILLLLRLLMILSFSSKIDGKITAMIVFGDSTVDAGNNNQIATLLKSNFKPYGRDFEGGKPTGRFCNGRLVIDFLSERFGLKPFIPAYLDPSYSIKDFANGVTFASAGTGYDNLTSDLVSVIPMWKELDYFRDYQMKLINYMGKNNAERILRDALYIASLGTNDFIENYYLNPGRSAQFTVKEYEDYLVGIAENFVLQLYQLGARKISLVGLPPIGCLPLLRSSNNGGACREQFNNLARDFDGKLTALVAQLRRKLPGTRIVFSNVLDPSLQIIANPHAYGFESVGVACCGTGSFELGYLCHGSNPFTCMDASKYVFWDAVHPTEKLYHLVANNLLKTSLAEFV